MEIKIHVATAGTLAALIGDSRKNKITNLVITGNLNGTDVKCIRDMSCNDRGSYVGELIKLDLSEANFISDNRRDPCGGNFIHSYSVWTGNYQRNEVIINGLTSDNALPAYMFYQSKLSHIILPNNITTIGEGAFKRCLALKSIVIPYTVSRIGKMAFANCSELTNVTLFNNITTIGEGAFKCCLALKGIEIPYKVSRIEKETFMGCTMLEQISIPENVEQIGNSAFEGCHSLRSIRIPKNVNRIDYHVFSNCSNLRDLYFENPDPTPDIDRGTLLNPIPVYCRWALGRNPNLSICLHVPRRTTEIYREVFEAYEKIEFKVEGGSNENIVIKNGIDCVEINRVRWATCNLGGSKIEDLGRIYTWEEAKRACPLGWRLPTKEEFISLINSGNTIWTTINGVEGRIYGTSINNQIFLPAAGCYNGETGVLDWVGTHGCYWSSTQFCMESAYGLFFRSGFSDADNYTSYMPYGQSVRCVVE